MTEFELRDLEITECIPNCAQCPGVWKNELIDHKIVCCCCKSGHNIEIKVLASCIEPKRQPDTTNPTIRGVQE